jgi:hypothetical protein
MGKLSDQRRSARRPGKRERARVKRHHRPQGAGFGGGAYAFEVRKCGQKKFRKVWRYVNRLADAHLIGESTTPKSVRVIKRPLYTITLGPPLPGHDMEQKIFVPASSV